MRDRGTRFTRRWLGSALAAGVAVVAISCSGDSPTESSNLDAPHPDQAPSMTPFSGPMSSGFGVAGNGAGQCLLADAQQAGFLGDLKDLQCTSNDVDISFAEVTFYSINDPDPAGGFTELPAGEEIDCVPNDIIYAVTSAKIANNASERYDLGLWINPTEGGDALTGPSPECLHFNLIPDENGSTIEETGGNGGTIDACGDVAAEADTITVPLDTLALVCPAGGATTVTVDACAAWSNGTTGSNDRVCPVNPPGGATGFRYGTTPGTTAKCRCEPLDLPINVKGVIRVDKVTVPAADAQSFGFTPTGTDFTTPFNLTDASAPHSSGPIDEGTYTITETVPGGWTLSARACVYTGTSDPADFSLIANGVSVELGSGEDVTCTFTNVKHSVTVTKTATETFTRKFLWDIDKSASPTAVLLDPGQVYNHPYSVLVDTTGYVDNTFAVGGNISINNPTSVAVSVTAVTDAIAGVGAATVQCPVTLPHSLAAGGTLVCTYSSALPDNTTRVNTASVTLAGVASPFTDTENVDFTGISPSALQDNCIVVKDEGDLGNTDPLGTVCVTGSTMPPGAFTAPKTFNYTRLVPTGEAQCGQVTYDNTATGTTNTTSTVVTDDASIVVTIECAIGCTLTQGYWKTHNPSFADARNGNGPPPDDTWELLGPDAEDTAFFSSGGTWFSVFWTAPKGNAYYILAHQYMAAVLNDFSVTPTSTVADAITDAEALFAAYTPNQVKAMKKSNPTVYQEFITLAGILAEFNEGGAGTEHCTEDVSSSLQ